jgi:hypothetical protein
MANSLATNPAIITAAFNPNAAPQMQPSIQRQKNLQVGPTDIDHKEPSEPFIPPFSSHLHCRRRRRSLAHGPEFSKSVA